MNKKPRYIHFLSSDNGVRLDILPDQGEEISYPVSLKNAARLQAQIAEILFQSFRRDAGPQGLAPEQQLETQELWNKIQSGRAAPNKDGWQECPDGAPDDLGVDDLIVHTEYGKCIVTTASQYVEPMNAGGCYWALTLPGHEEWACALENITAYKRIGGE